MRASFHACHPEAEMTNEVALGESHALAAKYGCPDAAAVVCQMIAACCPAESGYAVFAYNLSYGHYMGEGHAGRRWGPTEADRLEQYKHTLAQAAIAHRAEVEAIHAECFPGGKAVLTEGEREDGAAAFRAAMQARFGSLVG